MADKEEGDETARRGNEWEVVSLTASAYAAAPGPEEVSLSLDKSTGENEAETSDAMFMSGHFVFPPSQHENLPLEPEHSKTRNEKKVGGYDVSPLIAEEGTNSSVKDEENLSIEGLMSHEFPGIQIFDEIGNRISTSDVDFEKDALPDKEKNTLSMAELHSFHREGITDKSYTIEGEGTHDTLTPQDHESDSGSQTPAEGAKYDEDDLPYEAWWKRRALSLYAHAKEANTFWSIFIAAAVMGLVIIGHQWQQERWKVLHHKWQFGINDERMGRILGPISRFKDVLVGGHRRGSLVRGSATQEH